MKYKNIHNWNPNPQDAIKIQQTLAKKNIFSGHKLTHLEKIAGVDVSFQDKKCCAAICILSYPHLILIEQKTLIMKVTFPYIPTLLTFREGPPILKTFKKLRNKPDLVLFDGQGITHPRKMGLATHMGIWLNLPSIGCAKTPLYGDFGQPKTSKGSYCFIKAQGQPIGAVLRTKDNTNPIYVSIGYKITLQEAIKIILNTCTKYRIPQPLRAAHTLSKTTLKNSL